MDALPKTILVIPCYNEADRLNLDAFQNALAWHPDLILIFVDDGSRDETLEKLHGLASTQPDRVRVMHHSPNRGKAEAVRAGMLEAFRDRSTCVGFWDADLATPLNALPEMLKTLMDFNQDAVFGARVQLLGRAIHRQLHRHLLGRLFATVTSIFLKLRIYDSQCGAKLFRRTEILEQVFAPPFTVDWLFDVELIARMMILSRREINDIRQPIIFEYPLMAWKDVPGSKLKPKHYLLAIKDMLKLWLRYRREIVQQIKKLPVCADSSET
ncbi:MAG: glycosyltransferase [Magnetococcales bacterium]|nr:glycosyltransferase [Magnetococcales bacterium]